MIDSNKFGHKNEIGDFKYSDIKDLVNDIRDNKIKIHLNTFKCIKHKKFRNRT